MKNGRDGEGAPTWAQNPHSQDHSFCKTLLRGRALTKKEKAFGRTGYSTYLRSVRVAVRDTLVPAEATGTFPLGNKGKGYL